MHHAIWYQESLTLAKEIDVEESIKRKCRTQWYRDNYDEGVEYYKKSISIPFLDHLITELNTRFSSDAASIYNGFFLEPSVMFSNDQNSSNFGIGSIWRKNAMVYLKYLENDLKEFSNIKPELDTWHTKWKSAKDGLPEKLCDVLPHRDKFVFPNISFA